MNSDQLVYTRLRFADSIVLTGLLLDTARPLNGFRWLPKGPNKSAAHCFSIPKPRFPGDAVDGSLTAFDQQTCRFQAQGFGDTIQFSRYIPLPGDHAHGKLNVER